MIGGKTGFATMSRVAVLAILAGAMLCGCASRPVEPVVQQEDVVLFLEPGLRPESLQFPEYLLMEEFELEAHGRVSGTNLIGIGLKTKLDLESARSRCYDMFAGKGWTVDKAELDSQSLRLLASKKGETLEIRAVRGTGVTQVFILYRPRASAVPNG